MEAPNDRRNFVHKRAFRAAVGFISGGPVAAAAGFARSSGRSGGQPVSPLRLTPRQVARGGSGVCGPGFHVSGKSGKCRPNVGQALKQMFESTVIGAALAGPSQHPMMGPVGAGAGGGLMGPHAPFQESRIVLECGPGFVLGKDDQCYPKGSIPNKLRKWPRGRRPLGTPGEMAALAKAAAFGRRMETTVKRMQKIGVLKKPRRGIAKPKAQKLIGPGGTSIINVE